MLDSLVYNRYARQINNIKQNYSSNLCCSENNDLTQHISNKR